MKDIYESSKSDHEKLSRMRGMILELLIYSFVYQRYNVQGCIISKSCAVKINNKYIKTEEREAVDDAALNRDLSKFYVIKVRSENFDKPVMKYLVLLYSELHKLLIKAIIGCVTMETKERLEKRLELFVDKSEKFYYCFGKEELIEIKNVNFLDSIA